MRTVTEFPHRVVETHNTWIPLADGVRLAAHVWMPQGAAEHPVSAILEYLPYRKDDGTAEADATRHGYFSGHGFASLRVDIRGTGDSDGIITGEYTPQELADACEVIAWIAAQPWCTGSVGMIGYSWGGFNGLQVAALRPPALKAIVSAYSTDDRYADDCHYQGGCLLGSDMLKWASRMRAINALPPDPRFRHDWREVWLERLDKTPAFIEDWVAHQTRDAFWRQGSVAEDYSAIEAATLLVGGWADPYTNAVPRLLEHLTCERAGIIGPWTHRLPHAALPGPDIGFLQECVRWFGHHLAGLDTGVEHDPPLRVYLAERTEPAACLEYVDGAWVDIASWPPPGASERTWVFGEGTLLPSGSAVESGAVVTIATPQHCGQQAGVWCPVGLPDELAIDQRPDDELSACFDAAPLADELVVLGRPVLRLRLSADKPRANIAVRLCELLPSGESLLVTWALLDLTHRDGDAEPRSLEPATVYEVEVPLNVIGRHFERGARLRLAISDSYWPQAWPVAEPAQVVLHLAGCTLSLPVLDAATFSGGARGSGPFDEPERAPGIADSSSFDRRRRVRARDEVTGEVSLVDTIESRFEHSLTHTVVNELAEDSYSITPDDPLSARCRTRGETAIDREAEEGAECWRVRVEVDAQMSATPDVYKILDTLRAFDGGVLVFERTQWFSVPRIQS